MPISFSKHTSIGSSSAKIPTETPYKMCINYNNDSKVYVVPVLPEEIQVTYKGETSSSTIDMFGEVLHKGKRDAAVVQFSSFFPALFSKSYCVCKKGQFKEPSEWDAWLRELEGKKKPCHFVLYGSPLSIDMYADITSYSAHEKGGDVGTIYYTLELKEHRDPTIREIKVKGSGKNKSTSKSGKGTRTNNKESSGSFKVTASALHLRSGPNESILGAMPNGATITTDGKTDGNWVHVQYNGKWGWAYKDYLQET